MAAICAGLFSGPSRPRWRSSRQRSRLSAWCCASSKLSAANAQTQIEAERTSALVSLRAEVGTLALDLATGVIGEALDDDARAAAYVDRFLADMELVQSADAKAKAAK